MFPNRCECSAPGQCEHTGRMMSEGLYAECRTNKRFRLHLAGVDPTEWPAAKQTGIRMGKAKPAAKPLPPCIHLGPEIKPLADPNGVECRCSGKTVRVCEVHGRCTLAVKYDGVACCALGTRDICRQYAMEQPLGVPGSIEEALKQIAGPELAKLDHRAWCESPIVQQAHIIAAKQFAESIPEFSDGHFDGQFKSMSGLRRGRGYITCGGGKKYSPGIYLQIRMLRLFNQTLPVQVWHRASVEPIPQCIRDLPGVTVIDAEQHPARSTWRVLDGWPLKLIAGIYSGWQEWIFSDADNYCVRDPEPCFDANPTGAVLWPDQTGCDINCKWHSYGLEPPSTNEGTNGGTELFDLSRVWKAVMLSHWFDMHREFYYQEQFGVGGYGEQDARRAAFPLTGCTYTTYARRPKMKGQIFLQAGPDGAPMFVHRISPKPMTVVRNGKHRSGIGKRNWLPMERKSRHCPVGVHDLLAEYRA